MSTIKESVSQNLKKIIFQMYDLDHKGKWKDIRCTILGISSYKTEPFQENMFCSWTQSLEWNACLSQTLYLRIGRCILAQFFTFHVFSTVILSVRKFSRLLNLFSLFELQQIYYILFTFYLFRK